MASSRRNSGQVAQSGTRFEFAISTRGAHSWVRSTPTGRPDWTSRVSSCAQVGQRAADRVEGRPVAGGPAGAAVDDQVVRVLGDLRVEVVAAASAAAPRWPRLRAVRVVPRCGADRAGAGQARRDGGSHVVESCLFDSRQLSASGGGRGDARGLRRRSTTASISGARCRSGPGPGDHGPHQVAHRAGDRSGSQRRPKVESPCGGEDLDGQHARSPSTARRSLRAACQPERDVVLLHRRGRDRIDRRRHGQPLQFGDDARPGCTGRSCGRSRPRPRGPGTAAAHGIAPESSIRSVRRSEMEATSATEMARKSSTAATGAPWKLPFDSTRPSGSTTGLSIAEASSRSATSAAWSGGVPGGAVHGRGAAQRVGVLDPGVLRAGVRRDDRRPGQQCGDPGGRGGLARLRTQRLQVGGEHPVGAQQRLDAHRGGDVRHVEQVRRGRPGPAAACRACRRCR